MDDQQKYIFNSNSQTNSNERCSIFVDDKIIVVKVEEEEIESLREEKLQKENCEITQQNLP